MTGELLVAVNPDPESRLEYLIRLLVDGGVVFRTSGTWPRTKALYCHPVNADDWPAGPEIVEREPIRSCVRRGAAIALILERGREIRAARIAELELLVDTRERFAYRFAAQQVVTAKRALARGDHGVTLADRLVAAVERKSLADLVSSLSNRKLAANRE